ncbi:Lrp/AsnC family transcriptional regulator [Sinorhizobium garamanticum]|uniref:Lrp/AsnC family transcriptional regulator n=1 Tax=Sinorhizobium garamanticum TaxID=680247 RepID=A0ABY8DK17_9HYPH|nr:Lrp/AsnC family transcriptional regulator [Sinorhizobium garamanticum]WEX91260.1 Lrp/AsnC family transcriptional regulator [Sinorhizobium garamanticum]
MNFPSTHLFVTGEDAGMAGSGSIEPFMAPSVSKRVLRLEAAGVIRGFTLDVDTGTIGYQIRAMVADLATAGQAAPGRD